jgi:hypothetical protein
MERRVAEQTAEQRQLKDANTALSARALQLAQEAPAVKEELHAANAVSEREGEQRLALLEEINLVQTEYGNLRQQLHSWEVIAYSGMSGHCRGCPWSCRLGDLEDETNAGLSFLVFGSFLLFICAV